ncbi:MAG: hypothetical protein ACO1RX_11920 [Candidatus Sericytochromatia bacterium]
MVQFEGRVVPRPMPRPDFRVENQAPIPLPRPSFPETATPAEMPAADERVSTGPLLSAQNEPVDPRAQFNRSSGANPDQAIADLRSNFFTGSRVPASKMEGLQDGVDALLADPAMRQALIERYGLNSEANREALVAVTAIESGSNGDMGEVMTTVLNRALAQNLANELTGRSARVSVMDVVNESGQFASKAAVQGMIAGRDTPNGHLANFGPQAREVLDQAMAGQTSFTHEASGNYFFNQGGFQAGSDFRIGVHRFSDRNTSDTPYVQALMHDRRAVNWSR